MNTGMSAGLFGMALAVVLAAAGTAAGTEYTVNPEGTGDYPTIQAAVDAAADEDVIILADGTFTGDGNRDVVVPAKDITIRSLNWNYMNCIIDCGGSERAEHRGFHFTTDVGSGNAKLQYVGIINGYTTSNGGGIWVEGASPIIAFCAVANCEAAGGASMGGGVYVSDGAGPTLNACVVSMNTADYGGGLAVDAARGIYSACEISDNVATDTAGGIYTDPDGSVMFGYCNVVSNSAPRAGGVLLSGPSSSFMDGVISRNDATAGHSGGMWLRSGRAAGCTFVGNSATEGAGGVHCLDGTGTLECCIIALSTAGVGVGADAPGDVPALLCCDVFGNAGGNYDFVVGDQTGNNNNFSQDPLFCNWNEADYTLDAASPCLAAASPCQERVGRYGQGCDSPVRDVSWGVLKGMWR